MLTTATIEHILATIPQRTIGFSHSSSSRFRRGMNPLVEARRSGIAFVRLNSWSVRKNPCVARWSTRGETTDFNSASRASLPSRRTQSPPSNFATFRYFTVLSVAI